MANIGLVLITIAWAIQLASTTRKQTQIQPAFILVYIAGVMVLIFDGFRNNLIYPAALNLITVIVAATVLLVPKAKR